MKKFFIVTAFFLSLSFVSVAQFNLSSGSYTGAQILSGISACACTQVVILDGADVQMNGDWDLTSIDNLELIIEGSGSLEFSGSGGNRDELLMSTSGKVIIEDTNNTNALTSGNQGNVFINIGGREYKGQDFQSIIAAGGADSSGPLPIELKSFDAELTENSVYLVWVTSKEENFSHFEVERRFGEGEYETIGFVQGMGESLSDVSYDFTDYDLSYGNVYYRLKAVDIDGQFDYSPIKVVQISLDGQTSVYPNPARSIENVKITLPRTLDGTIARVALYDLNGAMLEEKFDFDANEALSFNKALKQGMYILKIQHNGTEDNVRVMIQ